MTSSVRFGCDFSMRIVLVSLYFVMAGLVGAGEYWVWSKTELKDKTWLLYDVHAVLLIVANGLAAIFSCGSFSKPRGFVDERPEDGDLEDVDSDVSVRPEGPGGMTTRMGCAHFMFLSLNLLLTGSWIAIFYIGMPKAGRTFEAQILRFAFLGVVGAGVMLVLVCFRFQELGDSLRFPLRKESLYKFVWSTKVHDAVLIPWPVSWLLLVVAILHSGQCFTAVVWGLKRDGFDLETPLQVAFAGSNKLICGVLLICSGAAFAAFGFFRHPSRSDKDTFRDQTQLGWNVVGLLISFIAGGLQALWGVLQLMQGEKTPNSEAVGIAEDACLISFVAYVLFHAAAMTYNAACGDLPGCGPKLLVACNVMFAVAGVVGLALKQVYGQEKGAVYEKITVASVWSFPLFLGWLTWCIDPTSGIGVDFDSETASDMEMSSKSSMLGEETKKNDGLISLGSTAPPSAAPSASRLPSASRRGPGAPRPPEADLGAIRPAAPPALAKGLCSDPVLNLPQPDTPGGGPRALEEGRPHIEVVPPVPSEEKKGRSNSLPSVPGGSAKGILRRHSTGSTVGKSVTFGGEQVHTLDRTQSLVPETGPPMFSSTGSSSTGQPPSGSDTGKRHGATDSEIEKTFIGMYEIEGGSPRTRCVRMQDSEVYGAPEAAELSEELVRLVRQQEQDVVEGIPGPAGARSRSSTQDVIKGIDFAPSLSESQDKKKKHKIPGDSLDLAPAIEDPPEVVPQVVKSRQKPKPRKSILMDRSNSVASSCKSVQFNDDEIEQVRTFEIPGRDTDSD